MALFTGKKLKHIGEKRKDEEEQFGHVKTRKYDALNYVAAPFELKTNVCVEPQQFNIQTKDFFLPSLQQIGDSIKDIREFYCPRGKLSIVPKSLTASLKRITEKLVTFLQEETFSLSQNSGLIDTAKPRLLQETDGFIFIAKTLCFPLNIPYSELPSDIHCDIVLMLPSQPAFVLTVVDNDTPEARKYNVSVARGLITSLNRFTDDDFSAVFGVVCKSHLDSWDTFQSKLKTLAHSCSRFVTFDSLYMSEGKYDKLITSFWASVAKVEPGDQFPDAERINFLTKEQCTVLLENMNSKYVFLLTLPKCGGTTLMLEVARRLQNFLPTYLMVKSVEDISKYRGLCQRVSTALISESPAITHVLDNNCESERDAVTESILPLHDDQTIKITWTFCSDFIRPQIMDEILDLFGSYRHVLLVGSAGEGKSVTGLLLLEHFRSRGISVLHATSAAKMKSAVQNSQETFIFCDDVFGKFRCTFTLTPDLENMFSRLQTKTNIKMLFTSRCDVYDDARQRLGKLKSHFEGSRELNLTEKTQTSEKAKMLDRYLEASNRRIPDMEKESIVLKQNTHGFAHSCHLFVTLGKENTKAGQFFDNPLSFAEKRILHLLRNSVMKCLLYLLTAFRGTLDLEDAAEDSAEKRRKVISHVGETSMSEVFSVAAEEPFLFTTEGSVKFSHPSFLEVSSNIIAKCDISFIIQYGPLELFEKASDMRNQTYSIKISEDIHFIELAERFLHEIELGAFESCCSHRLLRNQNFVDQVICHLPTSTDDLAIDKLLYWASSNGSDAMMKALLQKYTLTRETCHHAGLGCTRWGNHSALEYIISSLKLTSRDIDDITEDGLPCLIVAANQNNVEVCKVLIKHDVDVYITDPRMGANALHWAAAAGHYDGVEVLSGHISLEHESNGGVTPLFVAAENGHLDVFKLLLRKGAVINKQIKSRIVSLTNPRNEGRALVKQLNVSDEGFTPLHVASYEGHLDIVELLITEGADANLKAELGPPVAFAAKANDMCIFRLFLSDDRVAFSEVISAAYEYGRTEMLKEAVLHKRSKANDIIKATLRVQLETVKELLEESEEGLSSHIEGYSLLHLAAALNHGDIVDELLQRKIEVNKSSKGGFTALHGASITGSSSVVESLIRREADVDRLANGFGPLHFASMYGNTNIARILIQHQANIHLKGYHQWSPLHVASIHNQPDLVRLLLENNADVEALSEDLSTPLVFASYLNNMDIADILLDHGADLHPRGLSYHPLLGTALLGHPEAVNNLLQRGAKVNHVSAVGVSALHGAAYMGAMDVLECLLENEADPNLKLFEGISPEKKSKIASHVEQWCKSTPGKDINLRRYDGGSALHVAVDMGNRDMVRLLLKLGADPNLRNMNNETAIDIAREKKHSGILRLLESS
ncbi:uncharacterized protein LOC124269051 [Haliotis rubra]|uniref:uncharacterized protein LOC124269051 n=1 Tax=Haliotis rubra TaxID=36100 RepID=UPI001EE53072|nr:uncharacterized protein LOC124269051 [Haliotis rubra]XP_046560020.1 uncharacterized protein LOC124269051 [Haliotis rubra]XP_046560021.1 uncharacterized protein LOC124269051 [Haliotis rubra]XP_046560022.1 uncharacterized protein LOC124269051 [Haliotis rubra]XP_046560023.1 uncharacterized protein LOC124269051 [Haliotis rubra]